MMPQYNPEELTQLQQTIVGLRYLSGEEIGSAATAVAEGRCPPHLAPFWSLVAGEDESGFGPALFHKLSSDSLVSTYSFYAFFPGTYERIYHQGERPAVTFDGRTRGRVAILQFADGDGMVVKPLQSSREETIARLAGESQVGPRRFPSLDGFLTEEWIAGSFLTELPAEAATEAVLYGVGKRLGSMLAALHARKIYYNDATVSDPEGRSHLIIKGPAGALQEAEPECRLIDFGVSVLLDNFPNLEPEEVYNLVRTTPEFRLLSRMGLGDSEVGQFLAQYRQRLARASRDEILARDLRFMEEGLRQAARLIGPDIAPPFREGFHAGYG